MAATGAIAALKQRKKRKGKKAIKHCPVCKKETAHEQMFKGMFRTNIEYCTECRVMRRGD
jgi:hypothetical protein